MASTLTAFDAVRGRIAAALLAPTPLRTLGRFALRESQRRSVREIHAALAAYGGALVADAPGSGKTVLALATAAQYRDVLVVVPAAVREQWLRAAARAAVPIRIVTQEALSRGTAPPSAPLVIVDEAHHFRNAASARYRTLADVVQGRHLLLLTATPVVNRGAERDALLALFLGRAPLTPQVLAQVMIRRDAARRAHGVVRLAPLPTAADHDEVARALERLPPPFPTADGRAAAALVRVTLAFAWASSLAALDAALRRRLQRGTALADALRDGHWPTRDALRDWIVGPDATQLAFAFAPTALAPGIPQDACATLDAHLCAVRALREIVTPRVPRDTVVRADAIRALLRHEGSRRLVLLAHHAETVRALYAALRDVPGTVAIVGTRVRAAAGRWTRDEVLQRVGPSARTYRADDIRDIRLLLATDILAEGVELQGCATLVHGDAAWTPARLEQRLGRVARDGQHDVVHVTHFALPPSAARMLALARRLRDKRKARTAALSSAGAEAALRASLATWPVPDGTEATRTDGGPRCAAAWASLAGFIALFDDDTAAPEQPAPRLVAGVFRDGRWRVSTRATVIAQCVRAVGDAAPLSPPALHRVRRLLRQWQRGERARAAVAARASLRPALLRQVMRRLDEWLAAQPIASRPDATRRLAQVRHAVQRLRGVASERVLQDALREASADACLAAVEHNAIAGPGQSPSPGRRLSALLILRPRAPGDPARPAASPGSAATR